MAANTTKGKYGFWDFKKYQEHEWFRFLIILMTAIGGAYLAAHLVMDTINEKAGYEYERLDPRQLQHINTIYFDTLNIAAQQDLEPQLDNQQENQDSAQQSANQRIRRARKVNSDSLKCDRVLFYIQHEFNGKVDPEQLEAIRPYLSTARPLEAISFLATIRLQVRSYFWLTGPEVYFEIIFWSWFGVICSILFNLGMVAKNTTTDPKNPHTVFDSSEIPHQVAKLIYAPLCTLIIVLGYNYFSDQNIVDISSSKGLIVFAFIGGFYSARLIAFLDRLKEVILPSQSTSELPVQKVPGQALLQNITLELELDEGTMPAELISDIAEIGLSEAVVSLENNENGDVIPAVKTSEDQSFTFQVNNLKPGKYTITASWSKEVNGEPVNLAATQTEQLLHSDITIRVLLKKAEGEG
jgi:hypothetical protein